MPRERCFFPARLLASLTPLILLIPSLGVAQAKPADRVITAAVANMYKSASADSEVVSQAILGTNVAKLESKGKWVKIQTPDEYTGWVEKKVLRDTKQHPYASSGETVQVTATFANIYREKDITVHAPVITVPFETRLEVVAHDPESKRWLQTQLPDGRNGWIQQGDVTSNPKVLDIPESIELAKRFMGTPYLWGGRSTFGYDCSGFTQMIMRHRGINMPRDADLQAAWNGVSSIQRTDLQPGDLLFFGSSADKITHTGMYIGNGEFIHDTTHDHPQIQISRLDDEPWMHLLVASRRAK